jgi:hypothetical protein
LVGFSAGKFQGKFSGAVKLSEESGVANFLGKTKKNAELIVHHARFIAILNIQDPPVRDKQTIRIIRHQAFRHAVQK